MTAELLVDDKTFLRRREGDYELSVDNSTSLICVMKSGGHGGRERGQGSGVAALCLALCGGWVSFGEQNQGAGLQEGKMDGVLILISFYNGS